MGNQKYTVTLYIAAPGTPIHHLDGEREHSLVGHLYYKVSDGTEKGTIGYGFSPLKDGDPFGPGKIKENEYKEYQGPVYERQLEITETQYKKLVAYGKTPQLGGFNAANYNGLNNSCIDFLYGGLAYADIYKPKTKIEVLNKSLFERSYQGTFTVEPNSRELDKIPYQIGDEKNPLNTPPDKRRHENQSCIKAFGFSWKTGACWMAEEWEMLRRVREEIRNDPNKMSWNGRDESYQYAQTDIPSPSPRIEDLPAAAQKLFHAAERRIAAYHEQHGLPIDEEKMRNAAMSLASLGYSKTMGRGDAPLMFNIKDGQYLIGERNPGLILAAMDVNHADTVPFEESIGRIQQTAQRFEQEDQQRQMAQSQSYGRGFS